MRHSRLHHDGRYQGFDRRRHKGDFIGFLIYAHASCGETIEHLELFAETGSLSTEESAGFLNKYDTLGRKLIRFIQSVAEKHMT